MNRAIPAVAVGLGLSLAGNAAAESWTCDRSPLIVTNISVWNHDGAEEILIEDGRISWVGAKGRAPAPDNARRLDGGGATALPGFIDSHIHPDVLAVAKHLHRELDPPTEILPMTMRQTLASGVTTARAHLNRLEDIPLYHELNEEPCFPGPRLKVGGPGLMAGAPDLDARLMRGFKDAADARAKVEEMADLGLEWLALHNVEQFTDEELAAVFEAAENHDLKVMADANAIPALRKALEWPIVSAEYLNTTTTPRFDDDILAALREREGSLYVVPPIGYYALVVDYAEGRELDLKPVNRRFASPRVAEEMETSLPTAFEDDPGLSESDEVFATLKEKLGQLTAAGAIPVVGSDTGSTGQFHGDAFWLELNAWRDFGFAPAAVIDAATKIPAQLLDDERAGRIAPGAYGDLVLYSGDLASGDFDQERLTAVIKAGVVFMKDGAWVGPNEAETRATIEDAQVRLSR